MISKRITILSLFACQLVVVFSSHNIAGAQSIANTKHNLSNSGLCAVKATTESRICVFCHAPHKSAGKAPLWNREDSRSTYITYTSPTLRSTPGQPSGSSKLCLSCHDGTIALGAISSEQTDIVFDGGVVYMPPGHSLVGSDISDDHPVSFPYTDALAAQNPELQPPSALPQELPLDHDQTMQCATCHDAHKDDFGDFLRVDTRFSQLCVSCHNKNGWIGSIHESSSATWNGTGIDPWPNADGGTVSENGCQNCHEAHEAGEPTHLLGFPEEENNCLKCHNGNTGSDIGSALSQVSSHPVTQTTGVHQIGEDPFSMARHVECVDCHNPHAASSAQPAPPAMDGSLTGVSGVDINGSTVAQASFVYEICFKCHGDNPGTNAVVTRVAHNLNTRLEFAPDAVSFHPVASIGRNNDVPSLIPPLTENSIISCDDCHGASPGLPAGMHGSVNTPMLRLNYTTQDNTQESPTAYALCYSCHDRNSILSNQSFKEHRKHIQGEDAPCAACHDSHGIPAGLGNTINNAHLINFANGIVFNSKKNGRKEFVDKGVRHGECSLLCHGKDHDRKSY